MGKLTASLLALVVAQLSNSGWAASPPAALPAPPPRIHKPLALPKPIDCADARQALVQKKPKVNTVPLVHKTPPASSAQNKPVWQMHDNSGALWYDADKGNLERWVAYRNSQLGPAKVPVSTRPRFETLPYGHLRLPPRTSSCPGGRCPLR
jgi:hypothetical protein